MLFALAFIVIMIGYVFIKNPKSLYTIIFSLDFSAIFILLFANVMYLIRLGNYQYTYQFEYTLYSMISKISISYFDIKIMINVAVTLLISASAMFLFSDTLLLRKNTLNIVIIITTVSVLAFCILFFNSPVFIEKLYLKRNTDKKLWSAVTAMIRLFNIAVVILCFSPIVKSLYSMAKTRIILKRIHSKILLTTSCIIYAIILMLLILTPISNLINNYDIYAFSIISVNNTFIWAALILSLAVIALMLFGKFNIFNEKLFNRTYSYKNTSILTKDIRFVFHSYKNALFSIKLLSEKALASLGSDACETALKKINIQTKSLSEQINIFLNIYNQVYPNYNNVYINDCIESALTYISVPDNVTVTVNSLNPQLMFFGDKNLITECFTNLINNSLDAIKQRGISDGLIKIEAFSEDSYLCVSITDNGCGIKKKFRKKIFAPLYSTKQNHSNWGIGLAYTKNILLAHLGDICFKSIPNNFTEFQITLPLEKD